MIEHPEHSKAWGWISPRTGQVYGYWLPKPKRYTGWTEPDEYGGRSCYVEQGHYGHVARKPTWLYAVLPEYPELIWHKGEQQIHPWMIERYGYEKARRIGNVAMIGGKNKTADRNRSPVDFAELLISMAMLAVRKGDGG